MRTALHSLYIFSFFLLGLVVHAQPTGFVDLSDWDPYARGTIPLEKGWQFVWHELLTPKDDKDALRTSTRPLDAAQRWNQHAVGYPDLPREGYGSYYLTVLLPKNMPALGVDLGTIASSARVYWNAQEIGAIGIPGTSLSTTAEVQKSVILPLPAGEQTGTLLIQVANWSDNSPGLSTIPRIGSLDALRVDRERSIAFACVMIGIYLIMCLYHLALFFFRRREMSALVFSGICFLLSLRVLVGDTIPLHAFLPFDEVRLVFWGSYLSFSLLVVLFILLVTELFPFAINPVLRWIFAVPCLAYVVLIVCAPAATFTMFLWPFQIVSLLACAVSVFLLVWAIVQRRNTALLFLIGLILVVGSVVHDILKINLQWSTPSLSPLGTLFFIFILALALSRNAALSVHRAERLSRQFQKVNSALSRLVPKESLALLPRKDITEVQLGDHSSQTLTVLFADIRSFSRLQSNLSSDASFKLVNQFLQNAGPVIRKHGGFVEKYLGGGLMALFPGKPVHALKAALEIQEVITGVNAERESLGHDPIVIGIGLHYGPVMIGTVGESTRMDTTVISETVALAARVQGLTRTIGGQILATATTFEKIPTVDEYEHRIVGIFKAYHGSEPVTLAEFFGKDKSEIWERKRATRRDFERAINLYQTAQTEKAAATFAQLLVHFPEDQAAAYYLNKIKGHQVTETTR